MDYARGYSPFDQIRRYAEYDQAETQRLYEETFPAYEEAFPASKTVHEYTSEQDGNTVIVFNKKVVIVTASGDVREYARA